MNKRSIKHIDFDGKTVLVRGDFNVPKRGEDISDDSRIRDALPTLSLLSRGGAKVVICSHFGRPAGQVIEEMSLQPVRKRLSEMLEEEWSVLHLLVKLQPNDLKEQEHQEKRPVIN